MFPVDRAESVRMSSFIAVTLVLLHAACTMAADGQQKRPISMEQADSNYGLRPEDARRIERMLENGETSSVEQEELARHASTRSVTTTVSVPVMSVPL